jgi:D-sorbitol dehydrogenase (acceptor)
MQLERRIAWIIGGGRGLGRAVALALAKGGATLAVADVDATAAAETLSIAGQAGKGLSQAVDIGDSAAVKDAAAAVAAKLGRLDILVNCAAICLVDPLLEVSADRWDQVFAVNARGALLCMQAAATQMIPNKFGRIITITSPAAQLAVPLFASYGASKAVVDSLTKSAAAAWAPHGITVNSVSPGRMTGGMVDALDRDLAKLTGQDLNELVASRTKSLPMGRRVDPAEVASAVVYLASDAAAYVTAERFNFTGGQVLQ